MPAEQGERVIAMVDSLDSVSDVAELARLLGRVAS
jgi:hypothetical protein